MHKRLKAFTLLELLVAMAITGLVISIAGLVYNMLDKQFHSYRGMNEEISSVLAFNNRLVSDFTDASAIEKNEEGILVKRNNKAQVQYTFKEKNVLRIEPDRTDTFHLMPENVEFYFQHEVKEEGLIDELRFEAVILEEREAFHFTKQYGISAELNMEDEEDGN